MRDLILIDADGVGRVLTTRVMMGHEDAVLKVWNSSTTVLLDAFMFISFLPGMNRTFCVRLRAIVLNKCSQIVIRGAFMPAQLVISPLVLWIRRRRENGYGLLCRGKEAITCLAFAFAPLACS